MHDLEIKRVGPGTWRSENPRIIIWTADVEGLGVKAYASYTGVTEAIVHGPTVHGDTETEAVEGAINALKSSIATMVSQLSSPVTADRFVKVSLRPRVIQ